MLIADSLNSLQSYNLRKFRTRPWKWSDGHP